MSAQIIELLVFAGIAFFIINRLIATLGSTSEDDPAKRKSSFFGETGIKDVTYSNSKEPASGLSKNNSLKPVKKTVNHENLQDLIVEENADNIIAAIDSISEKLPSFDAKKFLHSAKMAFELIIEASNDEDIDDLVKLVDKRYISDFHLFSESYGEFVHDSELTAKISEVYSFANNIFVKVLFTGKKITSKIDYMEEEWTFSRSLISGKVDWFLTNIDRHEKTQKESSNT